MGTGDDHPAQRDGWEALLGLLGGSRAQAAERYRELRGRLVRLFEFRGFSTAPDLADETLDRVARKLAEGVQIQAEDPARYVAGVARFVAMEASRAQRRLQPLDDAIPTPTPEGDPEARVSACLDECLATLPEAARALLLDYQVGEGSERIDNRKRLAERLGIPLNALRIRAHRLRARLEECIAGCTGRKADAAVS
jgi:DNA-directed RNA polymerase specialized sigma24 family protein